MSLASSMYRNSSVKVPSSIRSNQSTAPVPNTAPVVDYSCLFSHDLKRKQKRWQDGKLKFHTFNKRIMVYDERGNFIGDMHWREDYDFDEGEEFQLERGCVIVQVGECIGSKQQDLSELIDKRYQDKEQRQARAAAAAATTPARTIPRPPPPGPPQRPLTDLTTTPRGNVIGRAVIPTKSPFEQRQSEEHGVDGQTERPAKRRKPDFSPPSKSGYAQSLFGAALSLSSWSASSQPRRIIREHETSQETPEPSMPPPQPRARPLPNLLQSVHRDVPLPPAQASTTPKAPKSHPRRAREPSPEQPIRQRQNSSRSSATLLGSVKPAGASRVRKSLEASRQRRDSSDDGGPDDDGAEISPPSIRAPIRKTPIGEKGDSRKYGAEESAHLVDNNTTERSTKAPASKKSPAPRDDAAVCDEDNQERSRLISRPRPSRKRRLLMVADTSEPSKRHQDDKPDSVAVHAPSVPVISAIPKAVVNGDVGGKPAEPGHNTTPSKSLNTLTAEGNLSIGKDSGLKRSKGRTPPPSNQAQKPAASDQRPPEVDSSPDAVPSAMDNVIGNQSDSNEIFVLSDGSTDTSDEDDIPVPNGRRLRQRATNSEASNDEDNGIEEPSEIPGRNLWLEKEFPFLPQGARLATLRRSIKSKEILGFVRETYDSPPPYASSGSVPKSPALESPKRETSEIPMSSPEAARETNHLALSSQPDVAMDETAQAEDTEMPQKSPIGSSVPELELENIPINAAAVSQYPKEPSPPVQLRTVPPPASTSATSVHEPVEAAAVPAEACAQEASRETDILPEEKEERANLTGVATVEPQPVRSQLRRPVRSLTIAQSTISTKGTSESNLSASSVASDRPATSTVTDTPAVVSATGAVKPNNPPFQAQRPRISNPATRGRKAALKSDAAGQLPQTIVPPALPVPAIMQPPRKAVPREGPKNTGASETVVLPGFTHAGGGAWSKTAYDLLGMERPTT